MNITFKNKSIFYETYGDGPAIVLLHGFLESSTMWQSLISQLAKTHTVITIDFPGHGKSEVIATTHTMELMAKVVHAILKKLQINTATFIGHSMGGYVVLAYVEAYNDEVEKLILLNSTPASDSEERKINRDRALNVIENNSKAFISMAISNLFAKEYVEKFASEIKELKKEAYTFPIEGIKATIKGMRDRKDRSEILKNFKREKYMILGKEDPILPISETKQLAKDTNVLIKIIDGGHMSLIENFRIIEEFVRFIG